MEGQYPGMDRQDVEQRPGGVSEHMAGEGRQIIRRASHVRAEDEISVSEKSGFCRRGGGK